MARFSLTAPNFSDCLTIGEAAEFLGVSTATLRNWDRSCKLKPRRHPQNGYRIYLHEDLEAVLRSADLAVLNDESFAPQIDWTKMRDSEHFVQFYENDAFLIESITGYVGAALREGGCSIVIGTAEHRYELHSKLVAAGIDVAAAEAAGRYVVRDAFDSLSRFMVNGSPDRRRFHETIGHLIGEMAKGGRRVHVFGEMVALLWAEGNHDGAIALEQLWNELAKRHRFALFCAYPINGFAKRSQTELFEGVCSCHTRVLPAESYSAIEREDERLRAISRLQQQACSLQTEIEHRQKVEVAFIQRERELADFLENATEGWHKVGGLDIGRTLVRRLVELYGGTVTAQCEGTDKGSEFAVRLPVTSAQSRAAKCSSSAVPGASAKRRVLVVDDNHASGDTMSLLLRVKGHDVRTARDGLEAIDVAAEFRPDFILMDVGMPKLNGYEATRRIRETPLGRNIFIVALTGWGQASDIARSREAGCSAHMVKPVDFAALDELLATEPSTG